jgi:DNA adenine methylase
MRRYDRAHTFFYCDPPYWQTEGYGVPFEFDQYLAMADFMRNCQGRVMVSINDHPDIRQAFEGLTMQGLSIRYSNGNNGKQGKISSSKELVITNWNAEDIGGLLFV